MKRTLPTALFLLTIGTIGTIGTATVAQPGPPPPRLQHGPQHGDPLVSYLALSAEQKTRWESAHKAFDDSIEPLREHIEATHEQIEQLMNAKSNDAAAIGNLMIDIRNTHDQIKTRHDALDTTLEGFLTAEQKTKFEAFRAAAPPRPPHP